MTSQKTIGVALLLALAMISNGQNPDNPILKQWTNKDAKYNGWKEI